MHAAKTLSFNHIRVNMRKWLESWQGYGMVNTLNWRLLTVQDGRTTEHDAVPTAICRCRRQIISVLLATARSSALTRRGAETWQTSRPSIMVTLKPCFGWQRWRVSRYLRKFAVENRFKLPLANINWHYKPHPDIQTYGPSYLYSLYIICKFIDLKSRNRLHKYVLRIIDTGHKSCRPWF